MIKTKRHEGCFTKEVKIGNKLIVGTGVSLQDCRNNLKRGLKNIFKRRNYES